MAATPVLVVRAGASSSLYVLSACGNELCRLWRVASTGAHPVAVAVPHAAEEGSRSLLFANVDDGIYLAWPGSYDVTTNGAASWRSASFGSGRQLLSATASPTGYYAVTARCPRGVTCTADRLEHATLGGSPFTTVADLTVRGNGDVSVAAWGDEVWLSEQTATLAGIFYVSTNGGRTFAQWHEPALACVTSATIVATSASSLWATCSTGLEVAFSHSSDGGRSWRPIGLPETSGTGGFALDPVAGDLALFAHGLSANQVFRISGPSASVRLMGTLPFTTTTSLAFAGAADGVAVGAGSLVHTTDGGARWSALAL